MKYEVSCDNCGKLTGPYDIGQDDAITIELCVCHEIEIEKLYAENEELKARADIVKIGDFPVREFDPVLPLTDKKIDTLETAYEAGWNDAVLECGEILSKQAPKAVKDEN